MASIRPYFLSTDHYGLVVSTCDFLGIQKFIDERIPKTSNNQKLTYGQLFVCMLVNALSYVSKPLYLTPTFFKNVDVKTLFGDNFDISYLNDDALGRLLDKLYEADVSNGKFTIEFNNGETVIIEGIEFRFVTGAREEDGFSVGARNCISYGILIGAVLTIVFLNSKLNKNKLITGYIAFLSPIEVSLKTLPPNIITIDLISVKDHIPIIIYNSVVVIVIILIPSYYNNTINNILFQPNLT